MKEYLKFHLELKDMIAGNHSKTPNRLFQRLNKLNETSLFFLPTYRLSLYNRFNQLTDQNEHEASSKKTKKLQNNHTLLKGEST